MKKSQKTALIKTASSADKLFERVIAILEDVRINVVRSVNNNMVIAYWHVGRGIVKELQKGEERAEYGTQLVETLSEKLTKKYRRGFSTTNLRYFRTFHITYADRIPEIRQIGSGELSHQAKRQAQSGVLDNLSLAVEKGGEIKGFSLIFLVLLKNPAFR